MPQLDEAPQGVLRPGWSAEVDDYVRAGGWSMDGKVLSVGDASGGVFAMEGTSGRRLWTQPDAHRGGVLAVAAHPRRLLVATAGEDGRLLIWDGAEGTLRNELTVGNAWVEHLAWSPEGNWIAAASGRTVRVWRGDGTVVGESASHASTVSALAWSMESEVATACYGAVRFFGVPSLDEAQHLKWKGSLVSLALTPGGAVVACGSQDRTVHFWRRATGEDAMMSGYPSKPATLCFDASGTLLATGGGNDVTVWSFDGDGPEGTLPGVHQLHVGSISSLSFAHRGLRLASGGKDSGVVVWQLDAQGGGQPVGTAFAGSAVERIVWRPDDRALCALDASGRVTTWRVR